MIYPFRKKLIVVIDGEKLYHIVNRYDEPNFHLECGMEAHRKHVYLARVMLDYSMSARICTSCQQNVKENSK